MLRATQPPFARAQLRWFVGVALLATTAACANTSGAPPKASNAAAPAVVVSLDAGEATADNAALASAPLVREVPPKPAEARHDEAAVADIDDSRGEADDRAAETRLTLRQLIHKHRGTSAASRPQPRGYSVGSGVAGVRTPPPALLARVVMSAPKVTGAASEAEAERALLRVRGPLEICHRHSLVRAPSPTRSVTGKLSVNADGSVSRVKLVASDLGQHSFESCVTRVLRLARFPRHTTRSIVRVSLVFTPPRHRLSPRATP